MNHSRAVSAGVIPLGAALAHADRCRSEGRLAEADALCRKIVDAHPYLPEARHLLGLVAHQAGRAGEAIEHVRRAVELAPRNARFHANLCEMYRQAGHFNLAVDAGRQAVRLDPTSALAWSNLGAALSETKNYEEVAQAYRRAIANNPNFARAHCYLGNALQALERIDEAIAAYRRAVELDPNFAVGWDNFGIALFEIRSYAEAAQAHRRAVAINPDFAQAHFHLGNALYQLKRFDEAIAAYRRAVAADVSYVAAWANLGNSLHHNGLYSDGAAALRQAIALAPDHPNAHSGLGLLLLMEGNFAEGWAEWEWRLLLPERRRLRQPERLWRGESLAGKHIYVQAEQGLGDALQFARYLPWLARRAGKVSFRVSDQLVALMRASLPQIDILGEQGDPAPYDYGLALLSLPHLFKTRIETIPAAIPYLHAPAEAIARWRQKLAPLRGLKIGLVWAGNPNHNNDFRRSLDPVLLQPLLQVKGTSFVNLQFGPRAADLDRLKDRRRVIDLSHELGDFAETAGAVMALDLVISVDTSSAHLAGALGKPVWVLLPEIADWRWLHAREDSPWYPNMRLFRQARGEDWASVVARVQQALNAAIDNPSSLMPFREEGERRAAAAAVLIERETARFAEAGADAALPAVQIASLAERRFRDGALDQAEELCWRALAQEPSNAQVIHLLGLIAHQSGKFIEAASRIRRAITLNPGAALFHANLGEIYRLSGRKAAAVEACRRAVALDPASAVAWDNLGAALFEMREHEEAAEAHRRAIAADPNSGMAHCNLGNVLYELRRFDEAIAAYRRAIANSPNLPQAHYNLGRILYELKHFDAAIEAYRHAVALAPSHAEAWLNLGIALCQSKDFKQAAQAHRQAIAINPGFAEAHFRLGTVLHDSGHYAECTAALRQAIALAPDHVEAHWGLGLVLLMMGEFGEGWIEYEWRQHSTRREAPPAPGRPWRGENLAGKHIYVRAEQGLGDTLQFARYITWLARHAGKVSLHVHQPLVALLRESLPGIAILGDGEAPAPYDYDLVLMSLPHRFKTRFETIPAAIPYLRAPPEATRRWREKLAPMRGLKIGLVWGGDPLHPNDWRRSLDPAILAPLLDVQGTSFVSLQFGPRALELNRLNGDAQRVMDLSRELGDFADTAGAVMALDLLISIDSSPVHLAGALGKPVWVLLPEIADWRWLLMREDSPWYPTMRLFRKASGEDWACVVARVRQALNAAIDDPSLLMPFKRAGERHAAEAAALHEQEKAPAVQAGSEAHMPAAHIALLAERQFQHGALDQAEELCWRALAQKPSNAQVIHLMGLIAHRSGKFLEAVARIHRAIDLNAGEAAYHANLGEIYRLNGNSAAAIEACRRALAVNPNHAAALNNLGIALFDEGKFDEALFHFDRVINLQSDYLQAHINRGNTLQRLKRFAEAEAAYRRALECDPQSAGAWNNLAVCLGELQRMEEAVGACRKAAALQPNDGKILENLASLSKNLDPAAVAARF